VVLAYSALGRMIVGAHKRFSTEDSEPGFFLSTEPLPVSFVTCVVNMRSSPTVAFDSEMTKEKEERAGTSEKGKLF
jgi:hypothetical protein